SAGTRGGRRFVHESDSYHDFAEAMLRTNAAAQSVPAWLICDRSFIRDYGIGLVHPGASRREIERYIADGYLHCADTQSELAQRMGIDGKNRVRTGQEHNRFAQTGGDEALGKGGTEDNQRKGDGASGPKPCLRALSGPSY